MKPRGKMRFNIVYLGPMDLAHLRRDFFLLLKYGLESAGHRVDISNNEVVPECINLVIGAYFQTTKVMQEIAATGIPYINVNTEVISGSGLNFNPQKTDLEGAYFPFISRGIAAWDVIADNMPQYHARGLEAKFLPWGFCPELEDIQHREKDLDYYFFGSMSKKRREIIGTLKHLTGRADHHCPYFVRNDRIARAKVNLNIIQDNKYSHVNSFRIGYLTQNRCCIVSEAEHDPIGYLDAVQIAKPEEFADVVHFLAKGGWKDIGERAYEHLKAGPSMKEALEAIL